jgi:hypothetical protein
VRLGELALDGQGLGLVLERKQILVGGPVPAAPAGREGNDDRRRHPEDHHRGDGADQHRPPAVFRRGFRREWG